MNKLLKVVTFAILMLGTAELVYADAAAGKAKSALCIACHGVSGISNNDIWPNLAGQKRGYLVKQIKAFRDGSRKDPMMAPMVKSLTDQDIENIADHFSSL